MEKQLIRGARVIDPSQQIDGIRDVLIENGCIGAIAESLSEDCPVFDGKGFILSPGLVDIHVHLRDPGFPEPAVRRRRLADLLPLHVWPIQNQCVIRRKSFLIF